MVFGLFRSRRWDAAADAVYAAVVRQSRLPVFYTDLGVPDTVDGRFDLIALHAFLASRRIHGEPTHGPALAQRLFDVMFEDMDRNLREMGVGDLSVGKHVKGMAKAYLGRVAAYDGSLGDAAGGMLEVVLRRNLYRKTDPEPAQVAALAAYMRQAAAALAGQPWDALLRGDLGLPSPQTPAIVSATSQGEDA